jgi:GntR family transcriptional regulator, trigonelline degradation regulator
MSIRDDSSAVEAIDKNVVEYDLTSRVERVAAPLREQVLDVLRNEIVELRLQPGQRLVERELIERLGVSRTTIREALRELAAEGLVTSIRQKGSIVAVPSMKEASEVYEVRALLEGVAARQFAERATETHIGALKGAFLAIERAAAADDPKSLLMAKDKFYDVLFLGADNSIVHQVIAGLHARVAVLRAASLQASGRPSESVVEIRAILDAVAARDGEAAAEAAAFHVRQAARTLFRRLGERAPTDEGGTDA